MSWPPSEQATLIVDGQNYTEWESVWVQERWTESFSLFRFTANEGRILPTSWSDAQFSPGDDVEVILGGEKVIEGGTIITRQASYNATQHMVQLTGKTYSFFPYKSSVFTDNGNFDGMNFVQIAQIVLKDYGGAVVVGTPDSSPFKKAQAEIGMKIWDYLEQLAREKNIILGTNRAGLPQIIGKHQSKIMGSVQDGINVLSMQCTITCEDLHKNINVTAMNQGDDQNNGTQASQIKGHTNGTAPRNSMLVIPMEHPPPDQGAAQRRALAERQWTEATKITANCTVQGWFTQGGNLWQAGGLVSVHCPMAMITGVLKAKTVTFQQDNNSGTTTTLELVQPYGLNDQTNANVGNPLGAAQPENIPEQPAPAPTPTGTAPGLGQQLGLGDIRATLGQQLGSGDIGTTPTPPQRRK
jgi:prophage tail gpP-like protein